MSAKKSASPPPEPTETDADAGTDEVSIDLRRTKVVPKWIEEVVAASYAMDHEDARSAGALGFMHRALVNTAMPYKDLGWRTVRSAGGIATPVEQPLLKA